MAEGVATISEARATAEGGKRKGAKGARRSPRDDYPRNRLKFTREGRVFVVVTLGVGVAAVNTGNNLLYLMLGLMLSLIVLSGVMSDFALMKLSIERTLPARFFVGTTSLVEIVAHNRKARLSSYSVEIEDIATGITTEKRCFYLKIAPGAKQVAVYRRTPEKRGRLRLEGIRLATRYPFGLFEKWRRVEMPAEVIVYPMIVPITGLEAEARTHGLDASSQRTGIGTEIAGLRDYAVGDEARAIHWRRSAALGRVVVRERERDEAARIVLNLDNARPAGADAAWDAAFERSISEAASMVAIALRRGMAVSVAVRGESSPLLLPGSQPDPIWRFLALLEAVPADGARPIAEADAGANVVRVSTMPPPPAPAEGRA